MALRLALAKSEGAVLPGFRRPPQRQLNQRGQGVGQAHGLSIDVNGKRVNPSAMTKFIDLSIPITNDVVSDPEVMRFLDGGGPARPASSGR